MTAPDRNHSRKDHALTLQDRLKTRLADAEHDAIAAALGKLLFDCPPLQWAVSTQSAFEEPWRHVTAHPLAAGINGLRDFATAAALINGGTYTFAATADDQAAPDAVWSSATHEDVTVEIQLAPVPLGRADAAALIDRILARYGATPDRRRPHGR